MYYLETGYDKHIRFRNAVIAALAAHAAVLLGVSFEAAPPGDYAPQIEVTLANRPSTEAPDDARLVAEANQLGSGDEAEFNRITTRDKLQSDMPSPAPAPSQRQEQSALQVDALTTAGIAERIVRAEQAMQELQPSVEGISPEVDRLNRELSSLQAELSEQTQAYADRPRVRRITSASAKQSVDAAYLLDWRRRLEAVGNKYYPEASVRYGIYGEVRLLVVIRSDGTLESVQVLSSSGYAVLDEAAIKIVRMAAPYSPFPADLKATTDKLEIIRTWHYEENELSSK